VRGLMTSNVGPLAVTIELLHEDEHHVDITYQVAEEGALKSRGHSRIPIGSSGAGSHPEEQRPPESAGDDVRRLRGPELLHSVKPLYPAEARERRVEGAVIVKITLDPAGNVVDTEIVKPLPFGMNEAAVEALRQWKFAPQGAGGVETLRQFNVTISFKLDEGGTRAPRPDGENDPATGDADARDVLQTSARSLRARADIEPAVSGRIPVDFGQTPLPRALETVASQAVASGRSATTSCA
jgi:TonB family protein